MWKENVGVFSRLPKTNDGGIIRKELVRSFRVCIYTWFYYIWFLSHHDIVIFKTCFISFLYVCMGWVWCKMIFNKIISLIHLGPRRKNHSTFYGEAIFDHGVVYACISPHRTCNFLVVHHTMICIYFLYITSWMPVRCYGLQSKCPLVTVVGFFCEKYLNLFHKFTRSTGQPEHNKN
jgi:hypothetical protein